MITTSQSFKAEFLLLVSTKNLINFKILRKTTNFLSLQDMFRQSFPHLQLKIKEAIHIQKELPSLNQQLHHVNLKLSF